MLSKRRFAFEDVLIARARREDMGAKGTPIPLWDRYSRGEFYPAVALFVLWNRIWRFSRKKRPQETSSPITLQNTIHFFNCSNKMQRRGEVFPLLFPIDDSLLCARTFVIPSLVHSGWARETNTGSKGAGSDGRVGAWKNITDRMYERSKCR